MGFILDVETENAPEIKTLPDGTETQVRILKAEVKDSKSGNPMIMVRLDVPDEPHSMDFNHTIMLPTGSDDEKSKARKLNRLKEFKQAFGLPSAGPINTDEMIACTAWAILAEEETAEYGKQNRVKRFILER